MILLLLLIMWAMTSLSHAHAQTESKVDFKVKATWVAHIKGGLHLATQLAATHDFTLVEKVEGFDDHYSLVPRRYSKRNGNNQNDKSIRERIGEHPLVVWAEEQIAKDRTKRCPLDRIRGSREDLHRKVGSREDSHRRVGSREDLHRDVGSSGPVNLDQIGGSTEDSYPKVGNSGPVNLDRIGGSREDLHRNVGSSGPVNLDRIGGSREDLHRKVGSTGPVNVDGSSDIWQSELEDWRAAHQNYGERQSRGIFSFFISRYWHVFNDSLWKNQWYLQDYRTNGDVPVLDLNAVPCYEEGITGKGVKIAILDDGLEWTHPDLNDNYDPDISTDFIDNDRDPMPRYGADSDNSHGTRCAGEIAMVANNSFCGVGVAYNARVGGIKLLDGPTTDLVEGRALIFALDKVDIYSSSWGPPDNGMVIEAPGRMAAKAFEIGANKGRGGRGAIYVFAAGNGKSLGDSCAADGYINSVYTVPVASATQSGQPPYYGERCAAILTTAYSSGNRNEERIATTDIRGKCTTRHSGTSAAAPLAAGIIGLTLEANPELTWRCVQHLIAWTSEVAVLGDDNDWHRNGAGFWVNTNFGFGLLNAHNMVQMARQFKPVPPKSICRLEQHTSDSTFDFSTAKKAKITFNSDGCFGTDSEINYLEHVQVIISLSYPFRGAVSILLVSPAGTKTVLMETRPHDNSTHGLKDWTLTSVHQWGEAGNGVWTVKVGAKVMPEALDLVKDKLKHSSSHLGSMRYGQHRQSHLDGSKGSTDQQLGSDAEFDMDDLKKYGNMRLNSQGHDQQLGSDPEVNIDDLGKYGNMRLNSQGNDQELGSDPDVNMDDLDKYQSMRLNSQGRDQELGSHSEVNMDDLDKYGSMQLNSQGHDQELSSDPEVNMDDLQPKYGREHLTRKGHDQELGSDPEVNMDDIQPKYRIEHSIRKGHDQQLGSDLEVNMDDPEPKYRREHSTRKGHDQQLGSNPEVNMDDLQPKYGRERFTRKGHDQQLGSDLEVNMNDLDTKYRSMYFNSQGHDNKDINLEKDFVDLGFDLDISGGDVNGPPRPRGQNFRYGHLRRLERSQQHDDHIDYGKVNLFEHQGQVDSVKILLHGTREMPDHYKNGRRGYSTYRHQRDDDGANEKRERVKRRF